MAGKWIRTDETPLQAGFRVSALRVKESRRTSRDRAAERVAKQRMEVDSAAAWGRFVWVEYVRRLHHQVHRIWSYFLESTQIKEGGVTIAACQFDRDVIDVTPLAPGELATASLQRANDSRKLQRSFESRWAKCAHLSVVAVEVFVPIVHLDCTSEGV